MYLRTNKILIIVIMCRGILRHSPQGAADVTIKLLEWQIRMTTNVSRATTATRNIALASTFH